MKIYFNSTFIETKRETDDLFVKGNNGNKLEAYFEDLDLSNVNISLRLVIGWSNNETTNELPMLKSFDNQYAYINLPKLKHDGNTQFIIKIYQNGTLLQTAIFTRNIKATLEANDNTNIGSDEYQGLSNQIQAVDDKVNANTVLINNVRESLNATDADVEGLEDRISTVEGIIANDDNVSSGEFTALYDKVTTNENNIKDLNTKNTTNENNITNLQGKVNDNTTSIKTLQTDVTQAKKDINDNKTHYTKLNSRVDTLEGKFSGDLTNSNWIMLVAFPEDVDDFVLNLEFTSNNEQFAKMGYSASYGGLYYEASGGSKVTAYNNSDDTWNDPNYQDVFITGGKDVQNLVAIDTLKQVAKLKSGGINLETSYLKEVDYNVQTGIFTFTRQDGSFYEVDLAIEKVVNNYVYNSKTQALELTLADGTVQSIPLSDFIKAYEGVENDQIQVLVQSGNKIQAILKDGSININHLNPKFANDVNTVFTAVGELSNNVQDNATDITALQNRTTALESKFTADLTGSKWTLFNPLPEDTPDFEYNLTFVSNGTTFTKIAYNKEQYIGLAYINSSGGVTTAYNASDKIWSETNYQTIEITSGTDVTNLEAIGTLKTIGARISGGINVDDNVKAELEALNIRVNGVSARVTALEQNQGSGGGSSGGTVFETQQIDIAVSDWTELPDSEPYTYFANVTLSKSLDNAISIELINNNPILFAKFGFAIGEVTAMDELEIYSIGKPDGNVTLTFETVSQTSSVNLIKFTIEGTSYSAEEGMTWGEWVASDYNTGGYLATTSNVRTINFAYVSTTSYSTGKVGLSDEIVADFSYILTTGGVN